MRSRKRNSDAQSIGPTTERTVAGWEMFSQENGGTWVEARITAASRGRRVDVSTRPNRALCRHCRRGPGPLVVISVGGVASNENGR